MKATQKPKVKFDNIKKMFSCVSVEETPGHKWFITGEGATPVEAFTEWRDEMGIFEIRMRVESMIGVFHGSWDIPA